jgi:hypothetical protein
VPAAGPPPTGPSRGGIDSASPAAARGRAAVARKAWNEADAALTDAARESPLPAEDLERLALAARMPVP